jgi:hypothetical protein
MSSLTLHFGLAGIAALAAIALSACGSADGGAQCANGACDASLDDVAADAEAGDSTPPDSTPTDVSDGTLDTSGLDATDARDAADAVTDAAEPVVPCIDAGCAGSATCCSDRCADTANDPTSCGACGATCSGAFCAASHCRAVAFANLLANTRVAVVSDGQGDDDAAAQVISSAFTSRGLTVRALTQDLAADLLLADGRPHPAAGETFVAVGGPFAHRGVQWLEANLAPLALMTSATGWGWMNRVPRTTVAERPGAWFDARHDLFVVQLAFDPVTTRLSCELYGYTGKGTRAAAYYLVNTVLPKKDTFPSTAWTVVEWIDADGDGVASAGDSFTPLASG